MKKTILLVATAAMVASCTSHGEKNTVTPDIQTSEQNVNEQKVTISDTQTKENKTTEIVSKPDYKKGMTLVEKSDCLTCHRETEKMIGPTYAEIASRYAGKAGIEDELAQKIIKGGSGNWGQVAMMPHPKISVEDAKAMVDYILSVKQ
jgi:cytochrome c